MFKTVDNHKVLLFLKISLSVPVKLFWIPFEFETRNRSKQSQNQLMGNDHFSNVIIDKSL